MKILASVLVLFMLPSLVYAGHSRWMARTLSDDECTSYINESLRLNLDNVRTHSTIKVMLQVLMAECGDGKDPKDLRMDDHLWTFAGSDMAIDYNHESGVDFRPKAYFEFPSSRRDRGFVHTQISEQELAIYGSNDSSTGIFAGIRNRLKEIYSKGDTEIFISGYAYHGRSTYSEEKIKGFNETAWGGGIGRSWINPNGNWESLFAMVFSDSHSAPQLNMGYGWQKLLHFSKDGSVGIGGAVVLVSRKDIFDWVPFPAAVPLISLNYGRFSILATHIPKLGGAKEGDTDGKVGHGDVTFVFMKYNFDPKSL